MRIEAVACNKGLGAQLCFHDFSPEAWTAQYGEVESLYRTLSDAGIAQEFLDKSSLNMIHDLLSKADRSNSTEALEEAQSIVVASGVPAMDDEVVGLKILKAYLMVEDELNVLKARLAQEPYESVERSVNPGCLVEPGTVILGFTAIKKGSPGVGVFGEEIPPNPYRSSLPKPGKSILEENGRWLALKRGVLVVEDDTFKILGPQTSETDYLLVAPDKMSVRLILRTNDGDEFKPTLGFLKQLITARHFARPPAFDKIQAALEAFNRTNENQDVLIISGKPSIDGTNGSLEILVHPGPALPEPDQGGRVDFKSFSYFRSVKKGEPLAKVIAPNPGTVGLDVFGEPLMPREVNPFSQALGKNTGLVGSDPAYIVAERDGRIVLTDGVPEVVDTLQIKDDVSLKTGNITFPGSVEVTGDVRDNLEIQAKGDVDIAGMVEDGSIVSEGAIVVKGGFTGTGKGVIKSKLSSVSIGFIRNQRIESHADIIVYNEVVNAQLLARKSILMKSHGHSVVGGHLIAYSGIEIFNAGNETGAKTILEVGKDFEVEMELSRKKTALKEIQADIDFLEKMSAKLQNLVRWGTDVKGDIRLLDQRSRGILQFLKPLKNALAAKILELEGKLYNPGDCHIFIRGEVFPGTILRYQDRNLVVQEPTKGKRWVFRGKAGKGSQSQRSDANSAQFDSAF